MRLWHISKHVLRQTKLCKLRSHWSREYKIRLFAFFVVGEIRAFCPCHALLRRRASVSFAVVCMLRISIILVMTFNLVSIAHVKADYWHSHAMVTIAVDLV